MFIFIRAGIQSVISRDLKECRDRERASSDVSSGHPSHGHLQSCVTERQVTKYRISINTHEGSPLIYDRNLTVYASFSIIEFFATFYLERKQKAKICDLLQDRWCLRFHSSWHRLVCFIKFFLHFVFILTVTHIFCADFDASIMVQFNLKLICCIDWSRIGNFIFLNKLLYW